MGKLYSTTQIKKAFWETFHRSNPLFFDYLDKEFLPGDFVNDLLNGFLQVLKEGANYESTGGGNKP